MHDDSKLTLTEKDKKLTEQLKAYIGKTVAELRVAFPDNEIRVYEPGRVYTAEYAFGRINVHVKYGMPIGKIEKLEVG